MQPSLNLILNILVEFHSNPFFQCGLLHCLSEFNNDTTKKTQTTFKQSSESYFYLTCQGYVAFQCLKVVLFFFHFSLLIFVTGSALSAIRE